MREYAPMNKDELDDTPVEWSGYWDKYTIDEWDGSDRTADILNNG